MADREINRENDLEHITTLLGQCLGRIDEQAYRLQRSDEEGEDYEACDALEREAALLQELVSSAVQQANRDEDADLNRIVDHSVRNCAAAFEFPVVVRMNLGTNLPRIACSPAQLAFAVQRALVLVLGSIDNGGEISIATRREREHVWLELESGDVIDDSHVCERGTTLVEFVEGFSGDCRVDSDGRGTCLVAMQLPAALITDG